MPQVWVRWLHIPFLFHVPIAVGKKIRKGLHSGKMAGYITPAFLGSPMRGTGRKSEVAYLHQSPAPKHAKSFGGHSVPGWSKVVQ